MELVGDGYFDLSCENKMFKYLEIDFIRYLNHFLNFVVWESDIAKIELLKNTSNNDVFIIFFNVHKSAMQL